MSKFRNNRSNTSESPKRPLVEVERAHTKKAICKLGALKPKHGMGLGSLSLQSSIYSEKAETVFYSQGLVIMSGFFFYMLGKWSVVTSHQPWETASKFCLKFSEA